MPYYMIYQFDEPHNCCSPTYFPEFGMSSAPTNLSSSYLLQYLHLCTWLIALDRAFLEQWTRRMIESQLWNLVEVYSPLFESLGNRFVSLSSLCRLDSIQTLNLAVFINPNCLCWHRCVRSVLVRIDWLAFSAIVACAAFATFAACSIELVLWPSSFHDNGPRQMVASHSLDEIHARCLQRDATVLRKSYESIFSKSCGRGFKGTGPSHASFIEASCPSRSGGGERAVARAKPITLSPDRVFYPLLYLASLHLRQWGTIYCFHIR